MNKLPALQGLLWIKQGIALFRRNPSELIALMSAYFFACSTVSTIPVIGVVIVQLLIPGLCLGLMQACRQVDKGEGVWSKQLLQGISMPGLPTQLKLGTLWLVGWILAILAMYFVLQSISDVNLLKTSQSQLGFDPKQMGHLLFASICATIVQIPFIMALWFAPALVGWHDMNAGKAIFYSFFSVWQSIRAFIIFGLVMLALVLGLSLLIGIVLVPLVGIQLLLVPVLLVFVLLICPIFYCSLYCSYENMFGSQSNWQKN